MYLFLFSVLRTGLALLLLCVSLSSFFGHCFQKLLLEIFEVWNVVCLFSREDRIVRAVATTESTRRHEETSYRVLCIGNQQRMLSQPVRV